MDTEIRVSTDSAGMADATKICCHLGTFCVHRTTMHHVPLSQRCTEGGRSLRSHSTLSRWDPLEAPVASNVIPVRQIDCQRKLLALTETQTAGHRSLIFNAQTAAKATPA